MGNLFHLSLFKSPSCIRLSTCKRRRVLRVVKFDGNIIEFESPLLVKELLINFEGFEVKSSKRASNHDLSPNFELKLGKIYYLFPSKTCSDQGQKTTDGLQVEVEDEPKNGHVKRIKVVITKKQLQELLSKKTSMEMIIFGIDKKRLVFDSQVNWKPSLVSIPEDQDDD